MIQPVARSLGRAVGHSGGWSGRKLRAWVALPLVAAFGCTAGDGAPVEWSPDNAVLLYTSNSEGVGDLFVMSGDSGVRITDRNAPYNYGQWSPDGRRIALQTRQAGNLDIAIMNADGSGFTVVVADSAQDVLPLWSPDGRSIAFLSTRGLVTSDSAPFPSHIYLVPDTGGVPRQVTTTPLTSSFGPQAFAPDGRSILMSRVVDGAPRLRLLDLETGKETPLTAGDGGEYGGDFSPDGTRLAFHSESESGSVLMTSDPAGGDRRPIETPLPFNYGPRWSPDGSWLVFTGSRDGRDWSVFAIGVDGTGFRPLVDSRLDEREGRWQPAE